MSQYLHRFSTIKAYEDYTEACIMPCFVHKSSNLCYSPKVQVIHLSISLNFCHKRHWCTTELQPSKTLCEKSRDYGSRETPPLNFLRNYYETIIYISTFLCTKTSFFTQKQ